MAPLRIALWNANEIDVMLLAETHLTTKYNFQIRGYMFYNTNHPDGKAHGGTGILIKNRIKHHFHNTFATNYLQGTSINIQLGCHNLALAAVYCPPRFTISEAQFIDYFNSLGKYFIAAGDYNAKHTHGGSRLLTP